MRYRPVAARWRGSRAAPCSRGRGRTEAGLAIVAVILSLALTGCGKKGPPEPPPDVPNTFPRPYPSE
jgi:hypothetical protein